MRKPLYLIITLLFLVSCGSTKYNCVKLKNVKKLSSQVLTQKADSIGEILKKDWEDKEEMKKEGLVIEIRYPNPVYFEKNCNSTDNLSELYPFIGMLIKNEEIKVRIHGNSDSEEYESQTKLSLERAEFIRDVLLKNGIEKDRIEILDEKAEQPVGPNDLYIKENRRVYFEIIK
ncbi:OmpA family protein [Psychroserpens sp. SPM9]|uniref:OmpA family protein n=1 Tax=Psychroserpens sp. SPM9 TaxID=2975598 RepID=UPI0021A7DB85|nr:OmpA family protein [Psychroserpens sp. SPM9]MDG5493232.1 hypothetical protein [Psychroserpens sp. SPM9]